ncbi:hypothetical protein FHR81_000161 [Actinoalloteichus hoggarensis]|uniref:Uncharacterized protein n=1 Tax=Actinoalloteichus hoggarensis TaxID=1470176 RepID=A0A221W303_9PSEU|nr:hypothetical protein [Actinoalloteichus hoggarensis]ASO20155.1 hypothetical protein AHOG_12560 [Actinoalloteichus hoggarensis]MBB5919132.1 hypothetical protein [Actinoalloteichus hoggarensis]
MTIAFPEQPEDPRESDGDPNPGRAGAGRADSASARRSDGSGSTGEGPADPAATWGTGDVEDLRPEALHEWLESGCTIGEARRWISGGFTASDAARWRRSGIYTPESAREWRSAGLTPYTVDGALRAGMTPRDAVRWRELGYAAQDAAERHLAGESPHPRRWWNRVFPSRPVRFVDGPGDVGASGPGASPRVDEAADVDLRRRRSAAMRELLRAGITAAAARGFVDAGWSGETALPWARRAVPPTDASIFATLGLTPSEGARRLRAGEDGASMMTDWWRSGVPIDEVAAWAGGGFTPQEAAAMRADGVDVEQASILRALGEDER